MFQYAAAKSLAVANGVELKIDITSFTKQVSSETPRDWALHIFKNIDDEFWNKEFISPVDIISGNSLLGRFYKRLVKKIAWINKNYAVEQSYHYSPLEHGNKSVFLDGYWQSFKYFYNNETLIKRQFDLSYLDNEIILKNTIAEIKATISVSLHIRRGDYINPVKNANIHLTCTAEYYYSAILSLKELEKRRIKIFIFSDDIEWCKRNLIIEDDHDFMHTGLDSHDLYLMTICKHNIIANSTFSWWGAWLNNNPQKIVVAPGKWLRGILEKIDDRLPEKWIKIEDGII